MVEKGCDQGGTCGHESSEFVSFSSFCLTLTMILFTLSGGCLFCMVLVLTGSNSFCSCLGSIGCGLDL